MVRASTTRSESLVEEPDASSLSDSTNTEVAEESLTLVTSRQRKEVIQSLSNYEKRVQAVHKSKDALKDLLLFPNNYYEVSSSPNPTKTAINPITPEIIQETKGTPAEQIIEILNKDYRVVEKNYQTRSGKARLPSGYDRKIPDEEFPHKPSTVEGVEKITLSVPILRPYKQGEDEEKDKIARQQNRLPIFETCTFRRPANESVVDPRAPPVLSNRKDTKVLIKCEQLQFLSGTFEPFFCSATLYDIAKRTRISETWNFECNEEINLSLLSGRVVNDPITAARSGLFHVTTPSPDIYLVIRVEKVLRGVELDISIEPYLKDQLKPKEREKLLKECGQTFPRLGSILQPFAWGSVQLFNENGGLSKESTQNPSKNAKEKIPTEKNLIPAEFVLSMKTVESESKVPNLVNSFLFPVNGPTIEAPVVRDILQFFEPSELEYPACEYQNTLFIYPESVNFTRHKDTNNSRNIFIKASLKDSDVDPCSDGLPQIYGKCCSKPWVNEDSCPVLYHKKNPSFYSEIKVQLPAKLNSNHHILFSFSHIYCQPKSKKEPTLENPLGYAAIPLIVNSKILDDQRITVPIAANILPSYFSPEAEGQTKWVDGKKPLFTFRTKLVSTVYTQDENLNKFFQQYHKDDGGLFDSLRGLRLVGKHSLVNYYGTVLNLLLHVIGTRSEKLAQEALISFSFILNKIQSLPDQGTRSRLLSFYIERLFDNFPGASDPLYIPLVHNWLKFLEPRTELSVDSLQNCWFFFEVIVKSMTLHLSESNALNSDELRSTFFSKQYISNLKALLDEMGFHLHNQENKKVPFARNIALFLTDLLGLMNRGFVLGMMFKFVRGVTSNNATDTQVKFTMLKIFCCYEHFVPLNLPISPKLESTVSSITKDFWKKHPLVGLLLDEVSLSLESKEYAARVKALTTLRDVLWKLEVLPEYSDPDRKVRIANMFFPFILISTMRANLFSKLEDQEKKDWGICFLFVLKNVSRRKLLQKWWRSDTMKNHLAFLTVIQLSLKSIDTPLLLREASFTILDVLEEFGHDMNDELAQDNSSLMEHYFNVFLQLLKQNQTVSVLSSLFFSLRRFMTRFQNTLFTYASTAYCSNLSFELLRYANSIHATTRSEAGSLFYLMVKLNYLHRGNFSRTKLQSTIAVSRLCGETGIIEFSELEKTLIYVARLAKAEFKDVNLGTDVGDLVQRLLKVIKDSIKISQFSFDPEMIADLTYEVSVGYKDSPELRITWIENLLKFYRDSRNWEELAQCKFYIAALIVEYLHSTGSSKGLPGSLSDLKVLAPAIDREVGLPTLAGAGEEGMFNSQLFTEKGLVHTLNSAIKYLKNGLRFETCIEVYNILLEIYQTNRDYQKLSDCFGDLELICDSLVKMDTLQGRMFNNFYRVSLFGEKFGDLAGKEMIYKEHATIRVAEFTERIKTQYSRDGTVLNMLPNTVTDFKSLDPKLTYYQIISVDPYLPEETSAAQGISRKTEWDRNFNISEFIYETPFTLSGKPHGDLSEQCKRKTIVTVERPFPCIKKRLEVVSTRNIILQPIENAIEVIQSRARALRRELNQNPPNSKTLQIQLQGAVLAQVNAGPLEVATIFFGEKSASFASQSGGPENLQRLASSLKEFLKISNFALKLNKTLISADQLAFQTECENGFAKLQMQINILVDKIPNVA